MRWKNTHIFTWYGYGGGVEKHLGWSNKKENQKKKLFMDNLMDGQIRATKLIGALPSDSASQLNILWHDGHSFRVNGRQIGVFKEWDDVSFRRLLQSEDCSALETEVILELSRYLTDQSLEREFPDQEVRWFLVSSNFSECNGSGAETVRFLDATSGWSWFPCRFRRQLLSRGLSSSGFPGSLFGSSHATWLEWGCFVLFPVRSSYRESWMNSVETSVSEWNAGRSLQAHALKWNTPFDWSPAGSNCRTKKKKNTIENFNLVFGFCFFQTDRNSISNLHLKCIEK